MARLPGIRNSYSPRCGFSALPHCITSQYSDQAVHATLHPPLLFSPSIMQAYPNYYTGHPQYPPQRPPPGPQPGTYLTGFSATYPHFVQPPHPLGAQVPPQGYQPFPGAVYPPEHHDGYPVVPDRRRDRDRDRDRDRERADKYNLSRSKTVATPNPSAVPLKSAMRKRHDRSASMNNAPPMQQQSMSRASSRAPSESRERTSSTGRRRTESLPGGRGEC